MKSPAKAHRERTRAAQHAAGTAAATRVDASEYELMLAKLAEDRRRLHNIQSMEQRAQVKAELIPEYLPWVEGALTGNSGVQDDVLMTVMVWAIDAAHFDLAAQIGEYAIEHDLAMPDQYQRNTATLLAEEFADSGLKVLAGDAIGEDPDAQRLLYQDLLSTEALVDGKDMPDQVRAKLCKAVGYAARALSDVADTDADLAARYRRIALDHLNRALALNAKVGVKRDIELLERTIKNSAAS